MKLRHILGGAAVTSLLLVGLAAPAFAADTGSSQGTSASVSGGDLTATLPTTGVAFPAAAASHIATTDTAQTSSVDVNDLTGTAAGWNVTIVASDLTGTATSTTIPAANVSLASVATVAGVTPVGGSAPSTTGITSGTPGAIGTATTLVSAPVTDGVGEYTQGFTLGLNVPADTLSDTYIGTVTVTVAPPS